MAGSGCRHDYGKLERRSDLGQEWGHRQEGTHRSPPTVCVKDSVPFAAAASEMADMRFIRKQLSWPPAKEGAGQDSCHEMSGTAGLRMARPVVHQVVQTPCSGTPGGCDTWHPMH